MTTEITQRIVNLDPTPLYDPERDGTWAPSVDRALAMARAGLAKHASVNSNSDREMAHAANFLYLELRLLVGALDAEAARDADNSLSLALPEAWRAQVTA